MTAADTNITPETTHSTDTSSNRPVVDMVDLQDQSSRLLKRSSCDRQSPVKKQKTSAGDVRDADTSAADSERMPQSDSAAVVVECSLVSGDGGQLAESSSIVNTEDHSSLDTCTGTPGVGTPGRGVL